MIATVLQLLILLKSDKNWLWNKKNKKNCDEYFLNIFIYHFPRYKRGLPDLFISLSFHIKKPILFYFPDELISVGNGCECNLAKGYWGVDSSNCQLDIHNCKQAGQQTRQKDGIVFYVYEIKFYCHSSMQ
jgi:hypothetical protein